MQSSQFGHYINLHILGMLAHCAHLSKERGGVQWRTNSFLLERGNWKATHSGHWPNIQIISCLTQVECSFLLWDSVSYFVWLEACIKSVVVDWVCSGGLVKVQITGFHPQSFWFSISGWSPEIYILTDFQLVLLLQGPPLWEPLV